MLGLYNQKAQAAMEFLMTYGWAILVVLVVISALAYFGVLSPQALLPEKCILPIGFDCEGYKMTNTGGSFLIRNGMGDKITFTSFKVSRESGWTCATAVFFPLEGSVLNGKSLAVALGGCGGGLAPIIGNKEKFTITAVYYKGADSQFSHTIPGELLARIEEGVGGAAEQFVCQNAEEGELCDGLDIVFGTGYRQDCCELYELCCP